VSRVGRVSSVIGLRSGSLRVRVRVREGTTVLNDCPGF